MKYLKSFNENIDFDLSSVDMNSLRRKIVQKRIEVRKLYSFDTRKEYEKAFDELRKMNAKLAELEDDAKKGRLPKPSWMKF